jgi:hypothetical protein
VVTTQLYQESCKTLGFGLKEKKEDYKESSEKIFIEVGGNQNV